MGPRNEFKSNGSTTYPAWEKTLTFFRRELKG
jgi:hypothetical protein